MKGLFVWKSVENTILPLLTEQSNIISKIIWQEKATFWAEINGGNGGEAEEGKLEEGECKHSQEGSV